MKHWVVVVGAAMITETDRLRRPCQLIILLKHKVCEDVKSQINILMFTKCYQRLSPLLFGVDKQALALVLIVMEREEREKEIEIGRMKFLAD